MSATYQYTAQEQTVIGQLQAANGDAAALAEAEFRAGRLSMAAVMRFAADRAKPEAKTAPVTFKLGQSGAISVYGLGRNPTTLYLGQWVRLAAALAAGDLERFVATDPTEHFIPNSKGGHDRVAAGTPSSRAVRITRQ